MTFNLPGDLYYWLVTTFSGNLVIFMGLALLTIAFLAATFRMPNIVMMVAAALFIVLLSSYVGSIFVLFLVVAGIVIFWTISKIFTR